MPYPFADIAFTPSVRRLQEKHGSRGQYARMHAGGQPDDRPDLGQREIAYLAQSDGFYLATVSESGWPYVQHRGGPRGFLKVLSPARLGFADFGGNRQYVSTGNAAHDDRAALIVMDQAERQRLKLFGHLRFLDWEAAPAELAQAVALPGYRARIERVGIIEIAAFDWNCPQHITRRFTLEQIEEATQPLQQRIAELEAQLRAAKV